MELLIVSGLSGAGKSVAMNALEDIGFFCIDNIPVALLPRIVDFALQGENQLNRVAVVMDVRGVRSSEQLEQALSDLDARKFEYEILFLDANDAVIQRRYKETQSDASKRELEELMRPLREGRSFGMISEAGLSERRSIRCLSRKIWYLCTVTLQIQYEPI